MKKITKKTWIKKCRKYGPIQSTLLQYLYDIANERDIECQDTERLLNGVRRVYFSATNYFIAPTPRYTHIETEFIFLDDKIIVRSWIDGVGKMSQHVQYSEPDLLDILLAAVESIKAYSKTSKPGCSISGSQDRMLF